MKKPEIITIFKCPYIERCRRNREVVYFDNEPIETFIIEKCPAPFLFHRETGRTLCAIRQEADKIDTWAESIKDIGRHKGRSRRKVE